MTRSSSYRPSKYQPFYLSQSDLDQIRQENVGHQLLGLAGDFESRLLAAYANSGYGDIRPVHGAVLRNLELNGTQVTSLALRAGITHRAMAKIVDQLTQLQYVHRRPDSDDRRASRICFTRRGQQLLLDSAQFIENTILYYQSVLGRAAVDSLQLSLQELITRLGITITASGQQALHKNRGAAETDLMSHNLGRYLAELAKDYATRCSLLMEQRGHRKIQIGHTAVLSHLKVDGMAQGELAEAAGISQQAIGKQVRSLQKLGYIAVSYDDNDRRIRRVNFTSQGYIFVDDLVSSFEQIKNDYIKTIGASAFRQLLANIQSVIDGLNITVPVTEAQQYRNK